MRGECLRSPGLYVVGNWSWPDESLPVACGQGAVWVGRGVESGSG